jgi:hypothetical protein
LTIGKNARRLKDRRFDDQAHKLVAQLKTPLANTRHSEPTANAQKKIVERRRMRGADTSEWDIEEMCDGRLFVRWLNGDELRSRIPKRKIGLKTIHPPTKNPMGAWAERNGPLINSQASLRHEYEWKPGPRSEDAATMRGVVRKIIAPNESRHPGGTTVCLDYRRDLRVRRQPNPIEDCH